jgi:hypothetical protein
MNKQEITSECCNAMVIPEESSYMRKSPLICWKCGKRQSEAKEKEFNDAAESYVRSKRKL